MKPLSFKITSDHLLLCVFLSLLWGVTDSSTTSTPDTTLTATVTSSTAGNMQAKAATILLTTTTTPTTTLTTKPPPENVENVKVSTQSETSITLMWDKVNGISTYILRYDNEGFKEETAQTQEGSSVTHVVSSLTAGTKYNFTLISTSDGLNSTGYDFSAPTAPPNTEEFKSVGQNETSITLQWKKVADILEYTLLFNGSEINVTASEGEEQVKYTVTELTDGTKYNFTLFTLFENVKSSGVNHTAVTAPPNAEEFKSVGQNETSITLQWKKVADILKYTLFFNGSEIPVTASEGEEQVNHTVPKLKSGTKYDFTLFTLFENVKSSGVKHTAVTAPPNAEEFKSVGQNETSITLQWKKVADILKYTLLFNGSEINVPASEGEEQVNYTVTRLTDATKYDFILFTLFENVKSSGVKHTAVTAPRNTEEFKSAGQTETSITLQWKKVFDNLNYTLLFNGSEIPVTASEGEEQVNHIILGLASGTKYDFTLFTLFENVKSSGVSLIAVTAPRNTEEFKSAGQTETSITLQWKKVFDNLSYTLLFNGSEIPVTASEGEEQVNHIIPGLASGTKYNFTLFTLFENVKSSGVNHTAVTVPSMVASVDVTARSVSSITLEWTVDVDKDWSYFLQLNEQNVLLQPDRSTNIVSHSFTSLHPGRMYRITVITMFYGLNSTAYKDLTVTAIDCASVTWHVTNSSIQGMIEGLFTNATATNNSQTHASPKGSNVSFSGLYPGATYNVSLVFESDSKSLLQCSHELTIIPPDLSAHCEYWAAGYSVFIEWNKPDGVWTAVEVNVTGKTHTVDQNGKQHIEISGFLPAKTYQVSLASLSGTVRSYEPFVFQCSTDPRGVIAGSVCAVLLFALLVCLTVFIFFKRPDIIRKKPFIGGSKLSDKKWKAISVAKFPDHFHQLSADENRGFSEEYESLIPVGTEQTRKEAVLPENKPRNRFNNVLPYDWCRVKLTTSNPNGTSDYINASYMPGYNSNREYIATQGPLPSTINDFWRMIWEQKVKGIVMVTNCTEGGRTKCERYWPADSQPCLYGELLVTLRSEQQEPNWILREFRVKHRTSSEERTVKHFHFTAWPDHGVPQGTDVLIQFRGLVRQHIQNEGAGAPTVVHCSAGVGRTGTIIALDVLLQQLEKERAVGINAFVHKMRLSRPYMVQTESQYVFLHQCIMDCLQKNEKTEENIYENADMIYANATALREFHTNA